MFVMACFAEPWIDVTWQAQTSLFTRHHVLVGPFIFPGNDFSAAACERFVAMFWFIQCNRTQWGADSSNKETCFILDSNKASRNFSLTIMNGFIFFTECFHWHPQIRKVKKSLGFVFLSFAVCNKILKSFEFWSTFLSSGSMAGLLLLLWLLCYWQRTVICSNAVKDPKVPCFSPPGL